MLDELLAIVNEEFLSEGMRLVSNDAGCVSSSTEFTVEAGRPDSISFEKALSIKNAGATRISVNPQSMDDRTLERIGRAHKSADIFTAFENVRAAGIGVVNADVIAGLPGEGPGQFHNTLSELLKLSPENITVHTLALKKGSALRENNPIFSYSADAGAAEEMLRVAAEMLTESGMAPYYLYRQKQTVGNLENTGYAFPGMECIYNMRMMQERQSVVALGAGAVSKLYFPAEDRIERIFNMADTGLYIEQIDEMLERKMRMFKASSI
jgi:oxygen-independent coproporphyrinogen-3 oxidase